jgi:hypothetical protein
MNLSLNRFTFFLFLAALFFSCTKIVTTDIGAGLIPPVDGVITKDTMLDVVSKNTGYDTVSVGISDNHVLGYINDNGVFGTTTASLNFQIAPTIAPFSWGISKDSIILDSVVLCLSYQSAWGDTTSASPLRLHVYSMDPEVVFRGDSSYNNTITFEKSQELTEFNTAKVVDISGLNDVDTTAHYKEVATNQLRIRLNTSFAQQILQLDSATYYRSDSAFYTGIRGLIVEPEQTGNALLSLSLTDTATHLSVYYHSKNLIDTLSRRFQPNSLTSASSNTILRNYQNSPIPSYIAGASTHNDDLIFMQTSPGVYATIQTPGIGSLTNRIIHRAELLMYQVPDGNDQYLTPPNLFLAALGKDSTPARRFAVPNDLIFSGTSFTNLAQFGVLPLSKSGSSPYYYSFDITRYAQGIVTKHDTVYNLVLYAPYNQYIYPAENFTYTIPIASPSLNTVGVGRVMLGGGSNAQYKMRLHIVYSDIH